jgi:hypothetical protein
MLSFFKINELETLWNKLSYEDRAAFVNALNNELTDLITYCDACDALDDGLCRRHNALRNFVDVLARNDE